MPPVLPSTYGERITFFTLRLAPWAADPLAIGLTVAQMADITTTTINASNALTAANLARANSKTATADLLSAVDAMDAVGRNLVAVIKAFAETQVDPNVVYSTALVPPPDTDRTPAPPPTVPTNIISTLNNDGSITLTWAATNAAPNAGTFFAIHRKLDGETNFALIGSIGVKKFIDTGLPQGLKNATYMLQAWRGSKQSLFSEQVTIQFGQTLPAVA